MHRRQQEGGLQDLRHRDNVRLRRQEEEAHHPRKRSDRPLIERHRGGARVGREHRVHIGR